MDENMNEMYQRYLSMPKFNYFSKGHDIYRKDWYVQTGLAMFPPNPHRHYTQEEFETEYANNLEMQNYLNGKICIKEQS